MHACFSSLKEEKMIRRCGEPLYPENAYFSIFGEMVLPPDGKETLEYVMNTLEPREADVFMCQYRDNMTYAKIGEKHCGITRERVRQIIVKALRKLRHPSRSKILRLGREAYLNSLAAENEEMKRDYAARITALEELLQTQDIEIAEYQKRIFDLDKQFHPNSDPLNKNIDELELSVRSWNCLRLAGVETVRDIINHADLCMIRNLGQKSYREIQEKLRLLGVSETVGGYLDQ